MGLSDDEQLVSEAVLVVLNLLGVAAFAAKEPEAVVLTIVDTIAAEALIMLRRMNGIPVDVSLAKHVDHVRMVLEERHGQEH